MCQGSRTYWAVSFDLLVFRPFVGEILTGTLVAASPEGIRVSLGFFESITVPAFWMLRPSVYTAKQREWVWETEDEQYPMPLQSAVRVRVKSWQYTKRVVTAKGVMEETTFPGARKRSSSIVDENNVNGDKNGAGAVPAMQITASICEDGLGLLEWWDEGEEDADTDEATAMEDDTQAVKGEDQQ